jgi:hypothetical protein
MSIACTVFNFFLRFNDGNLFLNLFWGICGGFRGMKHLKADMFEYTHFRNVKISF